MGNHEEKDGRSAVFFKVSRDVFSPLVNTLQRNAKSKLRALGH